MRLEGPTIEAEGREQGWDSWGGAPNTSGVRGRAPTAQRFSTIFTTMLASPDTIILLIVDHKI